MVRSRLNIVLLTLTLFATGCVEQIAPEQLEFEDLLVVEGFITDQEVPQEISLTRTFFLTESETSNAESGADVVVVNQSGDRISFIEEEPGRYLSEAPFAAEVGGSLQLFITTASGREYESSEVTVLSTPPIDSLYAEFTPEPYFRNFFAGRFSFFIDARANPEANRFYRWKWNSTFELSMRRPSRWLFINNEFIIRERGSENDSLQVEVCWQTRENSDLSIDELLVPAQGIERLPILNFFSEEGFMKRGYSLEVKQYAISSESYAFWNQIKETNEGQGSLSDTQPGTIVGNIRSLSNPDEIVLGFFEAAQEVSVRRQFDRLDFFDDGFRVIRPNFVDCFNVDSLVSGKSAAEVAAALEEFGPDYVLTYFTDAPPLAYYYPIECALCTEYGSNVRPDFWEDDDE